MVRRRQAEGDDARPNRERPMPRHLTTTIATLVVALLLLGGCGSDSPERTRASNLDPNEAVLAAFNTLDASVMDVSIAIDATPEQLAEAFEADLSDPADQAMVELLTQASFRMVGAGDDMAMSARLGTATVFEVRSVAGVAYLRADLATAAQVAGRVDPEMGSQVDELIEMLPLLASSDPSLGFIGDLAAGGWLSLEIPEDSEFSGLWESGSNPSQLDAELDAVIEAILDENTVIVADGTARGGDRYLVTVEAARIAAAFAENPLTAEAFGLVGTDPDEIVDQLLDEGIAPTWELDVVIIDGRVSSIRVDIASLSTDAPEGATLPILISFSASPTAPTAPERHTPIPSELLDEMMSEMGGLEGLVPGDPFASAKTGA
jgi:hypothetical protein